MFSSAKSHDVKGATIRGDGRSTTSPQRSYHLTGAESYSGQNTEVKKFFLHFFCTVQKGQRMVWHQNVGPTHVPECPLRPQGESPRSNQLCKSGGAASFPQ